LGAFVVIFLIIFGVGLAMALLAFLIGELFDLGDFGDSGDSLGADTPSPLSSRIIFVFMTAFGGVGFIAQSAGWGVPLAVVAGVIGGLAVAGGTFFLIVLPMSRQQGSQKLELSDLMDLVGEVTDDIPAGGVGKVALVPPGTGTRVSRAARSQNGGHIPPGTVVKVVHVGPGSITVTPAEYFSTSAPATRR
jgi:hypothetical protein